MRCAFLCTLNCAEIDHPPHSDHKVNEPIDSFYRGGFMLFMKACVEVNEMYKNRHLDQLYQDYTAQTMHNEAESIVLRNSR